MKKVVNIIASVLLLLLMGVNSEAEKNGIIKRRGGETDGNQF